MPIARIFEGDWLRVSQVFLSDEGDLIGITLVLTDDHGARFGYAITIDWAWEVGRPESRVRGPFRLNDTSSDDDIPRTFRNERRDGIRNERRHGPYTGRRVNPDDDIHHTIRRDDHGNIGGQGPRRGG